MFVYIVATLNLNLIVKHSFQIREILVTVENLVQTRLM